MGGFILLWMIWIKCATHNKFKVPLVSAFLNAVVSTLLLSTEWMVPFG